MKNKKYVWIIVFLYILFIFSNSLQIGETSSAISGGLTQFLLSILHSFGWNIPFDTFHHFIRKLAHFSEYAGLGILVNYALRTAPLFKNLKFNYALFWILPPSMDETIQHFVPNRYGCIQDVLIDMSGFLCATLIYLFIIHKQVKKHSSHF